MSRDWSEEIPPAPRMATVAEGTAVGGLRWMVRAGGSRESCLTVLDIELPDGPIVGGGGLGGPALAPGRFMNVSVHRSDPGLHYLVGRVHLDVAHLRLQLDGVRPATLDVRPVGPSAEFGVSFVAAILPDSADLADVTARGENGRVLDAVRTDHYQAFFRRGRGDEDDGPADTDWPDEGR